MERTQIEGGAARAGHVTGVVCGCPVEATTVRSFLRLVNRPRFGWETDETAVAGGGAAATITAHGHDRFTSVREHATTVLDNLSLPEELPSAAEPRLYGGFSFTNAHSIKTNGLWTGFPGASFILPAVQLTVSPDGAWLTSTAVGPDARERATAQRERWRQRLAALPEMGLTSPPGVTEVSCTPSKKMWREHVQRAVSHIQNGQLRKVVLAQAQRVSLDRHAVPADILARLNTPYPNCDRFLFTPEQGGTFFGATPERLVTARDGIVKTDALAGSIGRGQTPKEDERLANQLRESTKNSHEHELVVESMRDQLATVARNIEIDERDVRRLATVQHLRTPIRAQLDADTHVLELVEALHPTPAVGGLPPDRALATIQETEAFDRGWYAAPVGWFDANGNGTFSVALRSAVASGQTVTTFAGAGIVADSDPDEEWTELQLKHRPVFDELA